MSGVSFHPYHSLFLSPPVDTETAAVVDAEPISEKMKEIVLTATEEEETVGAIEAGMKTNQSNSLLSTNTIQIVGSKPETVASHASLVPPPAQKSSAAPSASSLSPSSVLKNFPNTSKSTAASSELLADFPSTRTTGRTMWLTQLDSVSSKLLGVLAIQRLQAIFVPRLLTKDEFTACVELPGKFSVLKKISTALKMKKEDKDVKEEGTFGVPLEILMSRCPTKIDLGHGPNPKTVPFYFAENIKVMLAQGLCLF